MHFTRRGLLRAGTAGVLSSALQACGGGGASAESGDGADSQDHSVGSVPVVPSGGIAGRVVIVGGGMAGATLAKYLRLWGGTRMDVTLVEREPQYTSNIMSSLVLSGQRTIDSLHYRYDTLRSAYGVKLVTGDVVAVDAGHRSVRLASGSTLAGERLVLAPGIDFDAVAGLADSNAMPHAWKAGSQTTVLAQQLRAMPAGGTVVLTVPAVPYRCPPGPYERACLLADWLKRNKPRSKLIVLDANADIVTERDNFSRAFFDLYAGTIEYRNNVVIDHVDPATMTLFTDSGPVQAQVVNLIPRQRAPSLVADAGLANATGGRFAGVDVLSYESTAAAGVHVIGDSSATTQPKAGHIANQEAKVCADALVRLFDGGSPDPAPVTNSACFSTITMSQASWLSAVFQYDPVGRQMVASANGSAASASWSGDHYEDMRTWFTALMADSFA
jgi:sulfide dehydrogenase [flavocytochrome c] flavoprotein subunit